MALSCPSQNAIALNGTPDWSRCDATSELWARQRWADKLAAGFTIGTNLSGDPLNTIQYLNIFANQPGMLWASLNMPGGHDPRGHNRLGAQKRPDRT